MNMQYFQEEYMFEEFILKTTSQNISYNTMFYYINNLLTSFFIIFSSLFTGLFLGFGLVTFMYNPEWKTKTAASSLLEGDSDYSYEDEDEDEEDEDEDEDFDTKYSEEFKSLKPRELSSEELKALRLKIVRENITDEYDESIKREVIMTYNSDTESFWYYTDHSTKISYTMLNTLARLFTITYDCKNLYLGNIIEQEQEQEQEQDVEDVENVEDVEAEKQEENVENVESKIDDIEKIYENNDINLVQEDTIMLVKSIFAKFKSYNNKEPSKPITSRASASASANAKAKATATKQEQANDIKNQFKYKGKLIEYVPNIENETESDESNIESNETNEIKKNENTTKMDYASFKKQFILNNIPL
jgi:hypothetical protein